MLRICIYSLKEGFKMGIIYNIMGEEVSIAKVFVVSKTIDLKEDKYGFAINIECFDVILTDFIKKEIEKMSALVLSYAPELQVYKHIKEKTPILEFKASKIPAGHYKINISNPFEEYMLKKKSYQDTLSLIRKSMIERITYLFSSLCLER